MQYCTTEMQYVKALILEYLLGRFWLLSGLSWPEGPGVGVWDGSARTKYLRIQGLAPKRAYRNTFQVGFCTLPGGRGLTEVSGIGVH